MKKIILTKKLDDIELKNIDENIPIFAERYGVLVGMLIRENPVDGSHGWILKIGGRDDATGYHETREECIESASCLGYNFFMYY